MKKKSPELNGVKEIARRANVSIGTVDRVIHNRSGVSEKTREKVNAIIAELDYQPNIFARRLASKKTLKLVVVIPQSSETDYWDAPLEGIRQAESEVKPYGIAIDLHLYELNSKRSFNQVVKTLSTLEFDGVLLAPVFTGESLEFIKKLKERNIPCVFINSDLPDTDSLSYFGPDLFQSGYLAAHLTKYLINRDDAVLIVNISHELDDHHHLLRKEQGFRSYYQKYNVNIPILKLDIRDTDYISIKKTLLNCFRENKIRAIFVTNSRVSSVARFLKEIHEDHVLLIGFDYTKDNLIFLYTDVIDFLICQKPREQGYKAIMALYQHLVHAVRVEKVNFMPIDIITRENASSYMN